MTRLFLGLILGATLAAGCRDGMTPNPSGENDGGMTYVLGSNPDEQTCEVDVDCPLDFICAEDACVPASTDLDGDGYNASVDCDDRDEELHPGRVEVCNGIDDDCSGGADEGVLNACGVCGPVAPDVCDLLDNDCNGVADDDCVPGVSVEREPNSRDNCQEIPLPPRLDTTMTITGTFAVARDTETFCFDAPGGAEYVFDVDSVFLGAPTDAVLELYDVPSNTVLARNDFEVGVGPDPKIIYTFENDTRARIELFNFEREQAGDEFIWKLSITLRSVRECHDVDRDGVSDCDGDCDDENVDIFPSQTESCDAVDNNCDGDVDPGCPNLEQAEVEPNNNTSTCELFTLPFTRVGVISPSGDSDFYCFFVPADTTVAFDVDAREPPRSSMLDSEIHLFSTLNVALPGTASNDNGRDPETGWNTADSFLAYHFNNPGVYAVRVRNRLGIGGSVNHTYSFSVRAQGSLTCTDADGDRVSTCEGDCDDNDPEAHFGHLEVCDGRDNDCDGAGDSPACTGDSDGDSFTGLEGDCDDMNAARYPGAAETCNFIDDDCDQTIDEGVQNACGECGDPPRELCSDLLDNDCDGTTDTDCTEDLDADQQTPDQGDCNDQNPAVNAAATEVCNGIDDDCDGLIDELVKNSCGECGPSPDETCNGLDDDCDGLVDDGVLNACGDCGPTPLEICNGLDDDCDLVIDDGVLNACGLCGPVPAEICNNSDDDCNGFADEACDFDSDGDGQTRRQGDCNETSNTTYRGAAELCNGVDDNCNGRVDDSASCPVPMETEANNSRATCNALTWPGRIDGVLSASNNPDFFCVTITVPGTVLGFDIDARELGSPLDSQLEILDSAGARVAINNNGTDPQTSMLSADSYVQQTFQNAGTYAIAVTAFSSATAGASSFYQLHVEALGGCLDLDRDGFTACSGDCDDFDSGTNSGAIDICDNLDNDCSGSDDDRCVGSCFDDVLEQNDTLVTASAVMPNQLYDDLTYCGGDPDYYSLNLPTGATISAGLAFDSMMVMLTGEIYAPDGITVLGSMISTPTGGLISATAPQAGVHLIRVIGPITSQGTYDLFIEVQP
jgi:hypothetical protein